MHCRPVKCKILFHHRHFKFLQYTSVSALQWCFCIVVKEYFTPKHIFSNKLQCKNYSTWKKDKTLTEVPSTCLGITYKAFIDVNMSFSHSKCLQAPNGNLWKFYQDKHLLYFIIQRVQKGTYIGSILFPLILKPVKFNQYKNI